MDQEAAAPATPPGTVHEGVPYASPDRLAAELAAPLGRALEAGESVIAVLDPENRAALSAALGSAAVDVEWLDMVEVHRVPAFTVAMRWARLTRRAARPEQRTTVVAQHTELPGVDRGHWARLDAGLTVALADLPITMLCACHETGDLDLLRATHPTLRMGGSSLPAGPLRDPVELVAEFPPPPPADLGPPLAALSFTLDTLAAVRRLVAETGPRTGLDPEHTADLVLAVNEIATNSVEHGPGAGELRIWGGPSTVAEVFDVGSMDVPFPGMVPPPPSGERGRGLWLASELTDVLQVWSDETGTTVRLFVDSGE
ncbi:ATP-binding protein [Pseudonocardia xishanensis]|uniref:Sensor histidine kinase n=1 Tax=Pseudonocardia xishanensis TaxID=630995 RepID=A0ABP8RCL3_9PSEU